MIKLLENISSLKTKILINQSERSKRIIISASYSLLVKLISIVTSFLLVSISITYINVENYGVWLTISSITTWISIFDIGIVTSLRNRITESIALKDWETARQYISTTYALLLIIIIPVWVLFLFFSSYINWASVFNTSLNNTILSPILAFVFSSFCLQFILKPINSVLTADQNHFLANLFFLVTNILSIACILIFKHYFKGSLYFIALLFGFMPCIVSAAMSIILFLTKYKRLKPSINTVNFKYRNDLLGLGFKFFIIQVSGLIIFGSNNLLISRFLGNDQVTYYNIVFRYFSIITIAFSLINAPIWTAYTDAFALKDWNWIKKVTKQANYVCTFLLLVTMVMLFISNSIYKLWINNTINIPLLLSTLMALNVAIAIYGSTYTSFINGTGKIRLQTYYSIITGLLHIPLGYYFMKQLGYGLNGLMFVNILWTSLSLILWSTQYKVIIKKSEAYIWN